MTAAALPRSISVKELSAGASVMPLFSPHNPGRGLRDPPLTSPCMLSERVCRVALCINIDHQNPAASFRHKPGQMHSKRRLADAAF